MHFFFNINYLHKHIIRMCAYAFLKLCFINEDRKVGNSLGHIKKLCNISKVSLLFIPVYIKNMPVCYNEPSPHMFTVGCTNRMTLVTVSGCRSSQNHTVMICFGNSSKTLRPFQRQLNVKCKRNISTKVRLAKTHSPRCQRKHLHLARDSLESDKLSTRQECVK